MLLAVSVRRVERAGKRRERVVVRTRSGFANMTEK